MLFMVHQMGLFIYAERGDPCKRMIDIYENRKCVTISYHECVFRHHRQHIELNDRHWVSGPYVTTDLLPVVRQVASIEKENTE